MFPPYNTLDVQANLGRGLLQDNTIGYALIDKDNYVVAITQKFSSILNKKPKELIGESLSKVKAKTLKTRSKHKTNNETKPVASCRQSLHWMTKPLKGNGLISGFKLLALFEENESGEIQALLKQDDRLAKFDSTVAGMFHELISPLAIMNSAAELMLEENLLNEASLKKLTLIRDESYRLSMRLKSFLNYTNNSAPKLSAQCPVEILEKVCQSFNLLNSKRVKISLKADSKLPLVAGDAELLYQVFFNLLQNAIDASTENAEVLVHVFRCKTKLPNNVPAVEIDITDYGTGIDAKTIKHIFEPFFTTKPIGKGTGLGLPIVRHIVNAHGGTLRLRSSLGKGTTAIVSLPVWKPKSKTPSKYERKGENTS